MIGYDRLSNALESAYRTEPGGYPPYNVEASGENDYRITMAVAGFAEQDLTIEAKENILTVSGNRTEDEDQQGTRLLYRGIANRSFERKFQLADYVRVVDAQLANGLLHVELRREIPEAMKPRKIEIRAVQDQTREPLTAPTELRAAA
ncbi:Hsp20 family protein [Candidatus Thiodictyon syntrophicum]|jgi:molecular chaperone IbpA|uniref:Heat-shock protein n=1 Tax=Candidatus Thiodictyon syntrophicum TaxID=1166950 RepID=A0A2K8UD40_9GAMM|nr:Hsp20 family protein [Candidatus Thiodictyon syntrophicum]AUB83476.1 heat-shock protein [Candidatus Thiodictyon syntrophicum]